MSDVRFDRADAIVMVGIPSHSRNNAPLAQGQQSAWATKAMELFADLFGGATALRSYKGIYKSSGKHGSYLWDDTILVQAFSRPDAMENAAIIRKVVHFGRTMRTALDQEAVFLVFNHVVRFLDA